MMKVRGSTLILPSLGFPGTSAEVAVEASPVKRQSNLALRLVGWIFRSFVFLVLLSFALTLFYRYAPVSFTPLMFYRAGENLAVGKFPTFDHRWVPYSLISQKLVTAAITSEDSKFYEHNGFDWEAIEKARAHNLRGRTIRGASTISQQVAKNVFLLPQRTWIRKGLEAYFTAVIELLWTKQRIMEVYLNVVELGDGVYGVEAASQKYFGKPAAQVSSGEAALIVAVLPNPRRFKISRPSGYVLMRQTKIKHRMPASHSGSRH